MTSPDDLAPAPPPRHPRQRRYTIATVIEVRQLAEAGWTPAQIQRLMRERLGVTISANTITKWADPGQAEIWQEQRRLRERKRDKAPRPRPRTPGLSDRTLLELRERGLSYPAITVVLALYHGITLTQHQVRDRLRALGVPVNPAKARPPRQKATA